MLSGLHCLPVAENSMASSRMPHPPTTHTHAHAHTLHEAQLNERLLPAGNSPAIRCDTLLPEENQSK